MRATDVMGNKAKLYRNAVDAITVEQKPLGLRDYLPHWLGGVDPRYQPLSQMLELLKSATDFYLGAPVSAAEVAFPFPVPDAYRDFLRSTRPTLSLYMPLSALPSAGILATKSHGLIRYCDADFDPEQLILTVEYTRASLTAILVFELCGLAETRHIFHDTHLGADPLWGGSESDHAEFTRVLCDMVTLPLKDGGNGASIDHISDLVLLGDSAGDQILHHAPKKVLGEQQAAHLVTTAIDKHKRPTDPLFVASRGVALDCWDRLNFRELTCGI
ncbi:uncharacterized protein ASPGLDRAFT_53095 [Aspergillus glaucus CBS 516.65]|uniref:Uncharacterized protein n=1 Tax=Aspergillus glaucus CBS 516.65 TaxID=1160497 RepID=A0A1L9V543_ASPGL|nr:hypothetical protein ASPGLDRAFT_53095 [Aspergillus glaucus CBS 516.65]OJJ79054.1 hypothetical protein ASPGLDRAFT_53095 [Aspergillus glaucus CBS 516.65]